MPLSRIQTQTDVLTGLRRVNERAGSVGLGGLRRTLGKSKEKADLDTVEGLLSLARAKGLDAQIDGAEEKPGLSVLQRLVSGLGSLNPAEAIMKQVEGTESFLTAYPKDVIQAIGAALTGTDYGEQTKRRYFGELAEYLGVENKIARFGLGLVGDILLDPSTYVGGTLVRGGVKATVAVTRPLVRTAGRVAEKVLPEVTVEAGRVAGTKIAEAGTAMKQAFGSMFVHGYGTTGETADKFLMFQNKRSNALRGLAISNAKRYGTDVMTDSQWEEFIGKLFTGKNAEFDFFDKTVDEGIEAFNKKFPELKFPLKDRETWAKKLMEADPEAWGGASVAEQELMIKSAIRTNVTNRMESAVRTTSAKIGKFQEMRQKLAQPFIADDLVNLKGWVNELRKELDELVPSKTVKKVKGKPFMASKAEQDAALANALSMEKDQLKKTILDLQARIDGVEAGIIEPAERNITKKIAGKTKYNADEIIQQAMRELDPKLRIKDAIAELDQGILKLTNEMFEKQTMLERVLQGKQVAKDIIKRAFETGDFSNLPMDLAAALRPMSNDPVVQKTLIERLARNTELARQAGIESPYAVYAPSIKVNQTSKQQVMDFLNGTRRLAVGSEGYKKEYRRLLKDEELLRDRSLFLRVEDQIATDNLTKSFFTEIVDDIGKPINTFKNEQEATAAGFKMLKEKGIFGKELGWIPEGDWKFFNGQLGDTYGAIDAIAKGTGFDSLNSLFKRFVTGPFASFHVRNWTSGKIQNYEMIGWQALHPQTIATGNRIALRISRGAYADLGDYFDAALNFGKKVEKFGDEAVTFSGKTYRLNDIAQAIQDRFAHSSFYQQDFNSVVREADALADAGVFSKEAWKSWGKKLTDVKKPGVSQIEALVGQDMPVFRGARVIGSYIELSQKSEAVIGSLMKGHNLDEALGIAEKAGFDYRKLTPFEAKVMRRIIPFYTFHRKNLELQLRTIGSNPERINQIIRSIDNIQNLWENRLTTEEKENLPTYLRESLSVPAGRGKEGLPIFIQSFGTPIEAFTNLVKTAADGKSSWERTFLSTLSQVTPYIKAPIEFAIGKDSFRQRDIKDVYNAKEYKDAPEFIKDFLKLKPIQKKSAEGKRYTIYASDPNRYLIMRSLFTSRGFTYVSNIFNNDVPGYLRVMESLSGIRFDEVNTEFYGALSDRQQREEIAAILRRYGIISEFTELFIPKKK